MSELWLYNSLTSKKARFIPIDRDNVRMYVCGMTVYDYCHIGHARVMVVFDTLARHLRRHYPLTYVRNITDIDDKIIARAADNGESIAALSERFIVAMHEDEAALGCCRPDREPLATKNVAAMIALINRLIETGHAYRASNGDVYYAVRSFPDYGKLARRNLDDLRAGERVAPNDAKRDPLDFVLWKAAKAGEPNWNSPWSAGRPGWHIECSAMSERELGKYFDIHGGGMDLKFPHHECEIAQSEGAYGARHVNYWIHNGFVQIDSEKMSKSLGNFFTVREVLEKFSGEVIRFFMLQTHYRSPLNYSDAGLEEAQKALTRLYSALQPHAAVVAEGDVSDSQHEAAFDAAMNDDLNTPRALAVLFETAKLLNKASVTGKDAREHAQTLYLLGRRLGLFSHDPDAFLKRRGRSGQCDETAIQALLEERLAARKTKDFARADAIREALAVQGIVIEDTKDGTEWRRS